MNPNTEQQEAWNEFCLNWDECENTEDGIEFAQQ